MRIPDGFDFRFDGEVVVERDVVPFDYFVIGNINKDDNGYYRFYPEHGVSMTCKQLRVIYQYVGEKNSL